MYELISNLILYGNLPEDEILVQLAKLLSDDEKSNHELRQEIYGQIKRLLELATQYGFNDNLWHNYLTYLLMTNENPFSMTCEKQGAREGTVNHFALNDFKVFYDLFHYDFRSIEKELNIDCFSTLADYKALSKPELMYNKNVSLKVQELSKKLEETKNEQEFFDVVTQFYKDYGVGMFGLNKAFRIATSHENYVELKPINNMDEVVLDDLINNKKIIPDVVMVDPPRKGCDGKLLETMVKMAPKRIVYVSCDPATLARDLKVLSGEGYEVEKVCAVDQFSHSSHVETVVRLRKSKF